MAEALSTAWVQGQALLSAQGPQAKALVLMAACCRSESCCPEEDQLGAWQTQERQQPGEAPSSQPGAHGLELMPNLAAVEAIAEQLIFQPSESRGGAGEQCSSCLEMHVSLCRRHVQAHYKSF